MRNETSRHGWNKSCHGAERFSFLQSLTIKIDENLNFINIIWTSTAEPCSCLVVSQRWCIVEREIASLKIDLILQCDRNRFHPTLSLSEAIKVAFSVAGSWNMKLLWRISHCIVEYETLCIHNCGAATSTMPNMHQLNYLPWRRLKWAFGRCFNQYKLASACRQNHISLHNPIVKCEAAKEKLKILVKARQVEAMENPWRKIFSPPTRM